MSRIQRRAALVAVGVLLRLTPAVAQESDNLDDVANWLKRGVNSDATQGKYVSSVDVDNGEIIVT